MHDELQSLSLGTWGNLSEVLETLGKPDGTIRRVNVSSVSEDSHLEDSSVRTLPITLKSITILPSPISSTLASLVPAFVSESSESLSSTVDSLIKVNNGLAVHWNEPRELGISGGEDDDDDF